MIDILKINRKHLMAAAIALAAVIYFAGMTTLLPLNEDSAIYISLAKALANGQPDTLTAGPVNIAARYYPPLYPALILPLILLFPGSYIILKALTALIGLALIALLVTKGDTLFKKTAPIIVILAALSPQIALYSRHILTEMPYMLFSIAALYFIIKYDESPSAINRYLFYAVLAASAAYYTRSIGVVLIISGAVYFGLKRDTGKGILYFLISTALVMPWTICTFILGKSAYAAEFLGATKTITALLNRVGYNFLATLGKELPDLFFYPFFASIDPWSAIFVLKFAIGGILFMLLAAGFVIKLKKDGPNVADIYVVIYTMIYLSWTTHGARYLLPLLPFLYYYMLFSLEIIFKQEKLFSLVITVLILINACGSMAGVLGQRTDPLSPSERTFVSAADWIKKNAPKGSLILSRRPNWIYVYTGGYRGLGLLRTVDVRAQYEFISKNDINYIVIDQNKIFRDDARNYLLPLVDYYKDKFEKVYASGYPETLIYKVRQRAER
jgi:hypothetical protein